MNPPTASRGGRLLAVLTNPPLTSGLRTLGRLELARAALGFDTVQVANLFATATHATGEISVIGRESDGWHQARTSLSAALEECGAVLLAYGTQAPNGQARAHFRDQINWLSAEIGTRALPTLTFGGGPRHPSRWQRWTSRVHPGVAFEEAVARGLTRVEQDAAVHNHG